MAAGAAPAATVVVPAYRSARTLGVTIRSVLRQERDDLELIVVDDGSPDSSAEIAARWADRDSRVRLLRQANAGTAAARAAGAQLARGSTLSFLDADDVWLPGYIGAAIGSLENHPERGLAFADVLLLDDRSGRINRWGALRRYRNAPKPLPATTGPSEALRRLLRLNFLTTSGVTVTRAAYDAAGGLDLSLCGVDDWDLWLRIAGAGFEIVRVPGELAILRMRGDSLSSDRALMARGSGRVLEQALERGLPPDAEAIARRHLQALRSGLEASGPLVGARRRLASLRRRLGARRPGPWNLGGWTAPPPEIERLLRSDDGA